MIELFLSLKKKMFSLKSWLHVQWRRRQIECGGGGLRLIKNLDKQKKGLLLWLYLSLQKSGRPKPHPLPLWCLSICAFGQVKFPNLLKCSFIYRILNCCFDLSPGISPSGWYRSNSFEGCHQGRDQNKSVMLFIYFCPLKVKCETSTVVETRSKWVD